MIRRIEPSGSGKNSVFLAQVPRLILVCGLCQLRIQITGLLPRGQCPTRQLLPTFEALRQAFEQMGPHFRALTSASAGTPTIEDNPWGHPACRPSPILYP